MTIRVGYEAHLRGGCDHMFRLEPEEEAKYLALPEEERDAYIDSVCKEHALIEDDWDQEVDRLDVYRLEIDGEDVLS